MMKRNGAIWKRKEGSNYENLTDIALNSIILLALINVVFCACLGLIDVEVRI